MCREGRRAFILAACALLATRTYPQTRTYRLATLSGGSDSSAPHLVKALFARLGELGYWEGKNLSVERRYAEGRLERLPELAAQLVALRPDVIFAITSPPALAASGATRTIPIVFTAVSNPVGLGIVKSLARPGTNATGVSSQNSELQGKRLQLLKEVLPGARQVAVLYNPLNTAETAIVASLAAPAKAFGLALRVIETKSGEDYGPAFDALDADRPDALYVIEGAFSFQHRVRIVELANRKRIPGVYGVAEMVDAGGLLSYNMSLLNQYRAAAPYIDKILRGARPADLPVAQPMVFEMIVNLKTAKLLGLTLPPSILLRADRVIE